MEKNNDILVEVKGIGKKFSRNLRRSLFYGLVDVTRSLFGLGSKARSELRKDEFWAIRNVNFSLRRGECVGLIGHNGAGKSTLLKMLNGLIRPDEGTITIRGRIGALIELGTGFNPILTGRENVYINGLILGFTREDIDKRLDAIIDFSEIREFIDSPVQSYSSGMKVRLGFAVAAQMDPDVLIIDEVLAVGDVGFRGKCMKAISEMMGRAAVIFVSHSMPIINRYCSRAILFDHGKMLLDDNNVRLVIDKYLEAFDQKDIASIFNSSQILLDSFSCNGFDLVKGEIGGILLNGNGDFQIGIKVLDETLKGLKFRMNFIDRNLVVIASVISDTIELTKEFISIIMKVGPINLQPGIYRLSLIAFGNGFTDPLLIHDSIYQIHILGEKDFGGNSVLLNVQTSVN